VDPAWGERCPLSLTACVCPPTVAAEPVFTSGELSALEKTCQGRSFARRRDAAVIAVLKATGIRAGELAGIRYDPHDLRCSDLDLQGREITVAARAAGRGSSGSGTRPPVPWTAMSGSGPGMRRRGGRSCGSG
jgi:hypothetical protein